MPMPHRTQQQIIRRRIQDKQGAARVKELRAALAELPNYRNGPYADLRKWVNAQITEAQSRERTVNRDSLSVPHQGAAQIVVVGGPNAGKSTLLQVLSDVQIATGDYAFTTTRPVPAVTRVNGVGVQLVEVPGLIEGAAVGRGGGRALLGVIRNADGMVLCHPNDGDVAEFAQLVAELRAAGIELPTLVAVTKADEGCDPDSTVRAVHSVLDGCGVVVVSALDDRSLDALREQIWSLTGLIRVFLAKDGAVDGEPIAFLPPVTVADVAAAIHGDLAARCEGARLWGTGASFPAQKVGRDFVVEDGAVVEVIDS